MDLYERLIRVIDAFITTFDGAMRLQGIHTVLLLQKSSRFGDGISPSEIHRLTGKPLENVRRRLQHYRAEHLVESHADPKDDRVTLFTMTEKGYDRWPTAGLVRALYAVRPPGQAATPPRALNPETYDALITVLQAFATIVDSSTRIRGFRTALLVQQATLSGEGITASSLSRQTGAALETVRRHMAKHTALGDLKMVEDPRDERATRVFAAQPDRGSRTFSDVARQIDAVDWRLFNLL